MRKILNVKRGSEVPTNNVESCEDNQPSLRGEALISAVPHSANEISPVQEKRKGGISNPTLWLVVYRQTTENPAVHSITGSNPVQPFGSMPCRKSSLRARAFSQLPRLTPSRLAASFSCWRSSGVMRIWKVGDKPSPFGVLSLLIVDMYVRNLLLWILLCTYVITAHVTKATPRSAGTLPRRLTTNVNRSNAMAMPQCNQTHPKNRVFIFLALNRADMQSRPHREVITAVSEREARKLLVGRFILVFAGRLPAKEIYHG